MTISEFRLKCGDCSGFGIAKKEFQRKNFWANLGECGYGRINWIQGFGTSRFNIPPSLFLVWRFCVFGLIFSVFIASIVKEEVDGDNYSFGYWMWFLTHWILCIHMLYSSFAFINTLLVHFKYGQDSQVYKQETAPRIFQAQWITMYISVTGGFFVMMLYWILLRDNMGAYSILQHGVTWGAVTLDFLFGKQPWLLNHAAWPVVFGLFYGLWTLIHGKTGLYGKQNEYYIYNVIKWNTNPGMAAFWAFGSPIVILIPIHLAFWALNFVRVQAIDVEENQQQIKALAVVEDVDPTLNEKV